jgi:trehalose 6-phosphate phosphatase
MKNILGRGQLPILQAFTKRRVLLAFDFDGTLAPIVRDPAKAAMRPSTAKLLAKLANRYPCVVISGRSRADALEKVSAIPLRAVVGNHGMEPSPELHAARRLTRLWRRQLTALLPPVPGLILEDKGVSLAIHYRQARARDEVRRLVLTLVARLEGTRIVEGKMVVNLLPANAPNKGTAVLRLRKRLRCESTIYVGDDDNDEDAFALAKEGPLLGIRVGRSRRSQAGYFLAAQADVDGLFAKLLGFRAAAS